MKDTLQEAIQREVREGATPIKEVVAGKNVFVLVRSPLIRGRPYISTCATIVGETGNGKVQVYLYAAGSEKRMVAREAIFTREASWCRGDPLALVSHARTHCWGIVYSERREYTRIYPQIAREGEEGESELTEEQVLTDFLHMPLSFQEVDPEHAFRKELRIVAHRGTIFCVRAEALLHRDWDEQYIGGYLMPSKEARREEPLGTLSTELHYVSTFLQCKTLYFAVGEAPDVFFIDRDFKQGTKRVKDRNYYLVHGGKIYEVRRCWESELHAYLCGELSLEALFRYAFAVGGESYE